MPAHRTSWHGPGASRPYGGPPPASGERFDVTSTIAAGQTIQHLILSDPAAPERCRDRLPDHGRHDHRQLHRRPLDGRADPHGQCGTAGRDRPRAGDRPVCHLETLPPTPSPPISAPSSARVWRCRPGHSRLFLCRTRAASRHRHGCAPPTRPRRWSSPDMLPYGAVAQNFTLTGPDGVEYRYARDVTGTITLTDGNPATAPTQAASADALGAGQYFYDVANGRLIADFGAPRAICDAATITAQWTGGQYQLPASSRGPARAPTSRWSTSSTAPPRRTASRSPPGTASPATGGSATSGLTKTGFVPATVGGADTSPAPGSAASAGSVVYYDATNHRIVARLASYSAGATATIAASVTGGQTVPETTAQTYLIENNASATGIWTRTGAAIPTTVSGPDLANRQGHHAPEERRRRQCRRCQRLSPGPTRGPARLDTHRAGLELLRPRERRYRRPFLGRPAFRRDPPGHALGQPPRPAGREPDAVARRISAQHRR